MTTSILFKGISSSFDNGFVNGIRVSVFRLFVIGSCYVLFPRFL